MLTNHRYDNEDGIVWRQPRESYTYLREVLTDAGTRRKGMKWFHHEVVAYSVLKADAPRHDGRFLRRLWYVKPHDAPGGTPVASGSVEVAHIRAGHPSLPPAGGDTPAG